MIIMPLLSSEEKFTVTRSDEHGGNVVFTSFEQLREMFADKSLHPGDLKASVLEYLKAFVAPIREASETPEMKKLFNEAYPPPASNKVRSFLS